MNLWKISGLSMKMKQMKQTIKKEEWARWL